MIPLELPDMTPYAGGDFEVRRFQYGEGNSGGAGQIAEHADPIWILKYSMAGFTTRARRNAWLGFHDKLEGIKRPALVFDPQRRVPLDFYQANGKPLAAGSPWGAPSIAAVDRAASTFDLISWTASQQLYVGDYISFQDTGGRWHLHRITADSQANGSGAVTVEVTPRPARNLVHGNAVLRVRDACCTAVLRFPEGAFRWTGSGGAPFTISGHQVSRSFL